MTEFSDQAGVRPGSFFVQPDPERLYFVPAKAEKLIRRGPREFYMVGMKPDGGRVEVRLASARFNMEGI